MRCACHHHAELLMRCACHHHAELPMRCAWHHHAELPMRCAWHHHAELPKRCACQHHAELLMRCASHYHAELSMRCACHHHVIAMIPVNWCLNRPSINFYEIHIDSIVLLQRLHYLSNLCNKLQIELIFLTAACVQWKIINPWTKNWIDQSEVIIEETKPIFLDECLRNQLNK